QSGARSIISGNFGGGSQDIISVDGFGNVTEAFNNAGLFLPGFQLAPAGTGPIALATGQIDALPPATGNDTTLDLAAVGSDGSVFVYNGGPPHSFHHDNVFPVSVHITDPNFTTLSDLSVSLDVLAPNLGNYGIFLVAPSGAAFLLVPSAIDDNG